MASGFFLLFRPSGESQSKDERLNHEGHEEHEEEQDEFFLFSVSTLPRHLCKWGGLSGRTPR
jgi:hypothetical protein